jgi:GH25 family lysozyme M1 (1,4-beta-N-acetylmuramidase)
LVVALGLVLGGSVPTVAASKPGHSPKPHPSANPTPTPTPPASGLEGLDVSVWQGAINWPKVAAGGKRFAFIRASAGSLTTDANYVANRAGAESAGLAVGAYHYANPDLAPGDALAEADHFLALATPRVGELLPVLDLEVSNGLSPAELSSWAMTWLERVRARLGVQALIYTSPTFWQSAMADTTVFAQAGYRVLWIANWGVSSPSVPAQNWDGAGWTFWQYTGCGQVPGIAGCVDLDRSAGLTLDPALFIPASSQSASAVIWILAWLFPVP